MLNAAKCHHVLNSITSIPQKFAISLFWFDKVSIVKTKWKKGPKLSKIYRSHKDGLIRLAEIWFMAQRNNLVPIVQTISLRVCLLPHPSRTSLSLSLSLLTGCRTNSSMCCGFRKCTITELRISIKSCHVTQISQKSGCKDFLTLFDWQVYFETSNNG